MILQNAIVAIFQHLRVPIASGTGFHLDHCLLVGRVWSVDPSGTSRCGGGAMSRITYPDPAESITRRTRGCSGREIFRADVSRNDSDEWPEFARQLVLRDGEHVSPTPGI
jgi:hypothetical protein